jgi:hypothetical protein
MARKSAAIVGMGQLGRALGEGLLITGFTVTGFKRSDIDYSTFSETELAVVATGEDDLEPVLDRLPESWRKGRLVLLQNELLPTQWKPHEVEDPTILVVWFSKKPGQPIREYRSSPVWGPKALEIRDALEALDLTAEILPDWEATMFELITKNAYIWTQNIAALYIADPVAEKVILEHQAFLDDLIAETVAIQERAAGVTVDLKKVQEQVKSSIARDGSRKLGGRTAPRRLERLMALGKRLSFEMPVVTEVANQMANR